MPIFKLAPVVGDKVVIRIDNICAFCSVERFGSQGRTGRIVPPPTLDLDLGVAIDCAPDHNLLVEYDLPWLDGRGGRVLMQYFRADEVIII